MFFKQAGDSITGLFAQSQTLPQPALDFLNLYIMLSRWILPLLAIIILARCVSSLFSGIKETETWAYISLPNGTRLPVNHWENTIGRSSSSDIRLNYPTISRNHAVLIREEDGNWFLTDLDSKGGVSINKTEIQGKNPVFYGDVISLSDVDIVLLEVPEEVRKRELGTRTKPGREIKPSGTFFMLTIFVLMTALQLLISEKDKLSPEVPVVFICFIAVIWVYYLMMRIIRRTGFEIELIAFFLSSMGLAVTASAEPGEIAKQFSAFIIGLFLFVFLGFYLRDLERAKKARWPMAVIALGLFAVNLLFGKTVNGSKNWISLGFVTLQPSELVKIAFIYAGTSTLDRLLTKRNLTMFIGFSACCVGALALMGDFGTASIFFVAFIVIAFLRSGDLATISLICAGTGFAGIMAVRFKPYILNRFGAWRHVWEFVNTTGYQQTRTMTYAASGGLLGLGAGGGLFKNIIAADNDLVFGMLCEERGLIIAAAAVTAIACLAVFTVRAARTGRSSFYVIAACAAMSMLVFQTSLNVFGSVDLLPLTGVTFPFISNGGSSMISSFGLLAFVKAADIRQNASFAIKLPRFKRGEKI